MNVYDFAFCILKSKDLEGKLLDINLIDSYTINTKSRIRFVKPCRGNTISFSNKQAKFPNKEHLKTNEGKKKAIHFFANHELLAIEMMAQAILLYPDCDVLELKKLIITLGDEQKHFRMYRNLINDFGGDFGDYPVNSFFWTQMLNVSSFDEFYALVAVTFEQANLDFAKYYESLFRSMGDIKCADVLKVVYEDEISHVARGRMCLEKELKSNQTLWDYYLSVLPGNITPSRAKGMVFDIAGREKAGLGDHFIENLKEYNDDFRVTKRKEWKS
jgi:uncharacterized ferritin-like protein (DUF455 family)